MDCITQAVHELAKIERKDILFFSVANNALAHLPYMIVIDHQSRYLQVAWQYAHT